MKITICGSMHFINQMEEAQDKLEALGHKALIPEKSSPAMTKKKSELISEHLDKINYSDAVLIFNATKNDIENYIGANSFLEIGFAHYRKKKIFLLNPIPNQPYIIDELEGIEPYILNGDLSIITL